MMDQQEMMELMMSRGNDLKPYPFEKIVQNTAMFKQQDAVDGLNINVTFPFGQNF